MGQLAAELAGDHPELAEIRVSIDKFEVSDCRGHYRTQAVALAFDSIA